MLWIVRPRPFGLTARRSPTRHQAGVRGQRRTVGWLVLWLGLVTQWVSARPSLLSRVSSWLLLADHEGDFAELVEERQHGVAGVEGYGFDE
jgi:hypothetical protein